MERKEPTFSGHSSTPLEANVRQPTESVSAAQGPAPSRALSAPQQTSSPMAGLALFLVVVSLSFGGFIYSQLQESQAALTEAAAKIYKLEQQLSLSDDESTQSVASLQGVMKQQQAELKSANSEIRKLWDTRNVNKNAIADNDKQVSAVSADLSKVKPVIANVKKISDDAATQAKKVVELTSSLEAKSAQVSKLQAAVDEQKKSMRELVDSKRQLESGLLEVQRKMRSNDETIASIDAFRKNTNSELWRLKQSIANAASPAPAAAPVVSPSP